VQNLLSVPAGHGVTYEPLASGLFHSSPRSRNLYTRHRSHPGSYERNHCLGPVSPAYRAVDRHGAASAPPVASREAQAAEPRNDTIPRREAS